jgi:hypothetical protein
MRFKQELKTNILTVDDEFATLESLDNGVYRYLVTFFVNPQMALANGAANVNIHISKNPNVQSNIPIFNTLAGAYSGKAAVPLNNSQAVMQLLQKSSVIKDTARASDQNTLMTIKADFTARISNELTQQLSKKDLNTPIVMNSIRSFKSVQVKDLSSQNLNTAIFESSIAPTSPNIQDNDVGHLKYLAHDLIVSKGIDPASLMVKQKAIVNSRKSFGGIFQTINEKHKLNSFHGPLISSLNASDIQKPRRDQLPSNAILSLPDISLVTNVLMQEYIDIPYGSISSEEFYIIFELVGSDRTIVQRLVKPVAHGKNIAALITPRVPPILNVVPVGKIGKNTLEIKQVDTNALGVSVYRKIVSNSTSQNNAEYTFIGKMTINVLDNYKTIDDNVSNGNSVIYRAIPYGQNDKLSAEFSSAIAAPVKIPVKNGNYKKRPNFVVLSYEFTNSGILIEIRNVPPGAASIILIKEDLSGKHETQYVEMPRLITGKGSEPLIFNDSLVSSGKIYKYTYKLISKDGHEEDGANALVIEYTPETSNVINTIIANPKVIEQGNNLDVQFLLQSSFVDKTEDGVRNAIKAQGLGEYFNKSINQENLQDLIAYGIVRTNLTTGDVEDLGVTTDKLFSDIKIGSVVGAKPIKLGCEYQYSVSTFFRSATSMLEGYVATVKHPTNSNLDYTYKPFDWLHPITLNDGTLVTKNSLKRNHSKAQFSFGKKGNIVKTNVSTVGILPSVYTANASKVNSKLVKIQWKVQGVVTAIDHFIIMVEVLGMRSVVGKCHNISDSNYFEFFDALTDGEKGALGYVIIPVYYDYSRGKEIQTGKVLI